MTKKIVPIVKPEEEVKEKSAISSVSIWGSLIAGASCILDLVQDPSILAIIPAHVVPYVGVLGAVMGIFGRVKAKGKITSFLPKK